MSAGFIVEILIIVVAAVAVMIAEYQSRWYENRAMAAERHAHMLKDQYVSLAASEAKLIEELAGYQQDEAAIAV